LVAVKKLVFVMGGCTDCDEFRECKKGQLQMKRVRLIVDRTCAEEIVFVDRKGGDVRGELNELGLPDIWMHDFIGDTESDVIPYGQYYFMIYNDGKSRGAIIVDEEPEDDEEEKEKENKPPEFDPMVA
jgi:hypothetical protein